MLSDYDRWKLASPPEFGVPELDSDDEVRLLTEILWNSYRKYYPATAENAFRQWLHDVLFQDDTVFQSLIDEHRAEIDRRWADEHDDPLDDGDAAYEARRDRDL